MLKGTRIVVGEEAKKYVDTINTLRSIVLEHGYDEVIIPSIWEQETFLDKVGEENKNMMWMFKDKGNRDVCLIPEVTGIIQEQYRESWGKTWKKPIKLFYISRCYRYERPQLGRYREFTQFGVEILGGKSPEDKNDAISLLIECLSKFKIEYNFISSVKRGLSYYTEDGFEIECLKLGAQKQIAGGGRYKEGIGWAIGIERLLLTI